MFNTFEGGTDGVAISVANSGGASGTACAAAPQPTSGNLWQYSTAAARQGALGARRILDATAGYIRWDEPSPSGRGGMRRPLTIEATPTAIMAFGAIRTAADGLMAGISLLTDRTVRASAGPSNTSLPASISPALTVGQTYWVEMMVTPGASTTTGRIELGIWDSTGTLVHSWDSGAVIDIGTTSPPGRYRFGGFSNAGGWTTDDFDSIQCGNKASGWWGPLANDPPTVTVGANQNVAAGATVNLTSSASDPDGSIASRAWTVDYPTSGAPALTGATSAAASFTAGAAGSLYVLRHTVTDDGGASTSATTEVRVPSTGAVRTVPGDGSGASGWSIIGGAATQGEALNDASATTRVESPDMTSTPSARRWRLAPMSSRTALRITLSDVVLTAAATHACKARVFCGSTQITERTLTVTTSDSSPFFDLTAPEITAITDWGNLWVEAVAVI